MPDPPAVQSIYADKARCVAENDCWLHFFCPGGVASLPTSSRERFSDIPPCISCLLACMSPCLHVFITMSWASPARASLQFPPLTSHFRLLSSFLRLSVLFLAPRYILSPYPCTFPFAQGRIACSKRLNFTALCCHPLLLTSPSTIHFTEKLSQQNAQGIPTLARLGFPWLQYTSQNL